MHAKKSNNMKKSTGLTIGIIFSILGFAIGFVGGAITIAAKDKNETSEENSSDEFEEDRKELAEMIALPDESGETTEADTSSFENRYQDVSKDFTFSVCSSLAVAEITDNIEFLDDENQPVSFYLHNDGNDKYTIIPNNPYSEGSFYFANLRDESIDFYERDHSIRGICFNVKSPSKNEIVINNDLIHYLKKESVFDCSYAETSGLFKTNSNEELAVGDIFCISESGQLDRDSLLGEITKIDQIENERIIEFKDPPLEKVFEKLDASLTQDVTFENFEIPSTEEIKKELKKAPLFRNISYAIASAGNNLKAIGDIWDELLKNFEVDFSFKSPTETTLRIEFIMKTKVSLRNVPKLHSEEYVFIKMLCSIDLEITVDANVQIKRGWFGIPYGIDLDSDFIQTTTTTFQLSFSVGTELNTKWPDSEYIGKKITEEFNQLNYLAKNHKIFDYKAKEPGELYPSVEDGKYYIPLGKVNFYILYIIDIQLDVGVETELSFNSEFSITRRQKDVCLFGSYSTKNGVKGAREPQASKATSWDISLRGKAEAGVYIKAGISLSITGLRWLFELGVEGRVGLYCELSGIIVISYNQSDYYKDLSLTGGICIEVGIKVDITLYAKLLTMKAEWTFKEGKFKLSRSIIGSLILAYVPLSTDLFIDEDNLDLEKFGVFNVARYDIDSNSIVVEVGSLYEETSESIDLFGDSCSFKTEILSGNEFLSVLDNKITIIDDKALTFNAKIKVTLSYGTLSRRFDAVYNVCFVSKHASRIYFDDEMEYRRIGDTITLPSLESTLDKRFIGWKLEGNNTIYKANDKIIISSKEYKFISVWEVGKYSFI